MNLRPVELSTALDRSTLTRHEHGADGQGPADRGRDRSAAYVALCAQAATVADRIVDNLIDSCRGQGPPQLDRVKSGHGSDMPRDDGHDRDGDCQQEPAEHKAAFDPAQPDIDTARTSTRLTSSHA